MPIHRSTEPKRRSILDAALKCFAAEGYDNVSIQEICDVSGASVGSVYHHFGSKEGLLEALIERRMGVLEQERAAALARLDETPQDADDVERLVDALVRPLAERVCAEPSWGCWVRVLVQLVSIRGESFHAVWQGEHDRASRALFRRLRRALPDLPNPLWQQRASDLMTWVTSSLCERARVLEAGLRPPLGREAFIENLILTSSRALAARPHA